jgi:hypothetical protein
MKGMKYSSQDRLGRQFIKTSSHQTSDKKTGRLLSLTSTNFPNKQIRQIGRA